MFIWSKLQKIPVPSLAKAKRESLYRGARVFLFCSGLFSVCTYASEKGILDANEHAVMFQKGVDAFNVGKYDLCDDYWIPVARAGDINASYNMGILFLKGYGVQKDPEEALLWFEKAATGGVTEAQNLLALLYIRGEYTPRNLPRAEELLAAAANKGDPIAQYNLAVFYEVNEKSEEKTSRIYELYRYSAESGNERAAARLKDLPIPKDDPKANDAATKAVQNAEEIAESKPENSDFGSGIELTRPEKLSAKEKIELYKEKEKTKPKNIIGFEKKLQKDDPTPIFKKDENRYNTETRPSPTVYSPFDVSSPENTPKAGETTKSSDIFAISETVKDPAEAAYAQQKYDVAKDLWLKALKKNDPQAAYRLGGMYEKGTGVKANALTAYRYYKTGSLQSHAPSQAALEDMRSRLTDSELMRFERATADLY